MCFLQPLTPARRHVIRPAAKWSGASDNLIQVVGHSSATSVDPGSAPSTSRDAKAHASLARRAIRIPVPSSTLEHTQPLPGSSSHTLSQPKLNTNSKQQDGTAHGTVELHAVSSVQTPSTSTNATTSRAPTHIHPQPQPSTSGLAQPQAGSSAHVTVEPQARTSTSTTHFSCVLASSSTNTQEKASTSTHSQDNPQASTSSAQSRTQTQSQPGTSTQSSGTTTPHPHLIQAKDMKLVVVPQQPSIQASALITQPQLLLRSQNLLQPMSLLHRQGNLIQIEPQPLAQAPAQPPVQAPQPLQVIPVIPPAVLIAAAPERLGPPEVGHRIVLGSQAPGEAVPNPPTQAGTSGAGPPAGSLNIRVPNSNPHAPPAPTASVPRNGGEARLVLAPAPNPERVNPFASLVVVPPAAEDLPRIEDARPGPSVPRERAEQDALVRTLITGVVSITSEQNHRELMSQLNIKLNDFGCGETSHLLCSRLFNSLSSAAGSIPRSPGSLCSRTDPKE